MQISGIGSSDNSDFIEMAKAMAEMRKKIFAKLDTDSSSSLDKTELAGLADRTGLKVDDIITKYDSSGDGTIDATEADTMLEDLKPQGPPPPPPEIKFDDLDEDGDGVLDTGDLANLADILGQEVSGIMTKYDTDGDGVLSATEASQMLEDLKPQGPPPGQQSGSSSSGNPSDSKEAMVNSLLNALKESDNDDSQVSKIKEIWAEYMQNMNQTSATYGANNTTNGALMSLQA